MSQEYLYTNPEHNEHITQMEIKTRLANIDDTLHHMRRTLRDIADALAEMTHEMNVVTPEDEEGLMQ